MDKISHLSDDLLIKILSFLETKDSVATSILSKRWMTLWTLVPRLVVDDYWYEGEDDAAREIHWRNLLNFVYGTLMFHKAPILETFHLSVASERLGLEVNLWVRIAVERFVRDLKIGFNYDHGVIRLPNSLFRCETLETLELNRVVFLEVPHGFSFSSLRTLRLLSVKYADEESYNRIISSCPVLEDLTVESCMDDNVAGFTINKPSLCSLTIRDTLLDSPADRDNFFVIHSHSLKLLTIEDLFGEVNVIGNMPKLVEANLQSLNRHENVLKSLINVKRLSLCLHGEAQYPTGTFFLQLVRLELCMCLENWSNMFVCVLQHSPKLQSLKLMENHGIWGSREVGWIQPSSVPECLLFHLKTFEWEYYYDFEEEKEVAIYILKNAKRLVTAAIIFDSDNLESQKQIYEELEIATRGSRACEITIRCVLKYRA